VEVEKSTYTAGLCRTYKKQYPDNKIILFSNKPSDPVFDRLEYIERVVINEDLLEDPITLNELEDCLVVFDDVEYNTVKEIDKELDRIRDLILQQGTLLSVQFCVYITSSK
jgi:ADP-heptose:LPS heptosyltransferase